MAKTPPKNPPAPPPYISGKVKAGLGPSPPMQRIVAPIMPIAEQKQSQQIGSAVAKGIAAPLPNAKVGQKPPVGPLPYMKKQPPLKITPMKKGK